ncbi:hypothetical protein MLD38_030718 [Melastoma candidum]|uniref:Uncharacterized protein n=1 Tax=Melastoma candidum TaxID=119954 RepID=A0ACB9MR32_9MYRT|nr:hypothetical protein MLD38_030718 [Melastoma candidum]
MGSIQLNFCGLSSSSAGHKLNFRSSGRPNVCNPSRTSRFRGGKVRAIATVPDGGSESVASPATEPSSVNFIFVSPVLLPDGTPDVHQRVAVGGRKLRNIMLDANIDLYGPYGRPLLNCAGGGTCATCMVEVVQGSELLSPKTDKEKEKLKRKPKNWRLACQTVVGKPDSRGTMIIQQLPEWKAHEWKYEKISPSESS